MSLTPGTDGRVYVVVSKGGHSIQLYSDEDTALDNARRTDTMWTCNMIDWERF